MSLQNNTLVTIIIPTFKRPTYLHRAISSVLSQSYPHIELVVVDDNNDGDLYRYETERLMETVSDSRIKYVKHKKNRNGSAARNTGLANSNGEYITFLDDDDEFLPDKIREQVDCMQGLDESWVACYTLMKRFRSGKLIDASNDSMSGDLYLSVLKNEIYLNAGSNLLLRRSVAVELNGFDESFRRMQDLEFLIRVSEKGKIAGIPRHLLNVHLDDRQVTYTFDKLSENVNHFFNVFESRIEPLPQSERAKVYLSKRLDLLRLLIGKGDISSVIRFMREHQIGITTLARYIFYLANRRLAKLCYGFKL